MGGVMKHEVIKNENNEVTVRVSLTSSEFAEGVKYSYSKNKNKYSVPGFRKGKAPQLVIERHYGEGVFYEDAANHLISEFYPKAVDELGFSPASKPEIDVEGIGASEGLVFTVVFAVNPEFEIGEYRGLEIEKVETEVDEKTVEERIDEEREKNARLVSVEREAKSGDTVNIDFVGTVDGEAFEGGSMQGHDLKLGSNSFIPGFEDQLIGAKAGDHVTVRVKFPEDYRAENLAGADAVFECTVHSVKETVLPELDDDFAKDVSEFDTLQEYKDSVRKTLNEELAASYEERKKQRIFEAAAKLMTVEIPERIIETEIDNMIEHFSGQLKRQGMSPDQYFEFMGGEERLRADMRNDAIARLKQTLVMEKIMKQENVEVTEEEINNEYTKMAEQYQISFDTVKSFYEGQGVERLKTQIEFDKTLKILMDSAVEK